MAILVPSAFGNLLTNILIAILILLLGFVAGKIIGLLLNKIIISLSVNRNTRKNKKIRTIFSKGLSTLVSLCIYIATVIFALKRLGILKLTFEIILVILTILISGAIFFAIMHFITNLIFGINIITSNKFQKGDIVKIRKVEGTVERVGLARTKLKTASGDIFVFSNRMFFRNKFSVEKQKTSQN